MEALTGYVTSTVNEIRGMNVRQLLLQAINLGELACTSRWSTLLQVCLCNQHWAWLQD